MALLSSAAMRLIDLLAPTEDKCPLRYFSALKI
jgi:hypothetical protein